MCWYKNAGVAGYAEAFRPVQSDSQTSEWYSYFENDVLGSSFHDQIAVIIDYCTDQSAKTFVQLIICIICLAVGNLSKETNLHSFVSGLITANPSFVLSAISASEANNVNLSLYGALAYGQKLLQLPHSLHI